MDILIAKGFHAANVSNIDQDIEKGKIVILFLPMKERLHIIKID